MERKLDEQGRWRNRIISFRVSEEEGELLDNYVKASGLTKQEYVIQRILNREVVVQGNTRVHKALRNQMQEIFDELQRIQTEQEISHELQCTLQFITEIFDGLKGGSE